MEETSGIVKADLWLWPSYNQLLSVAERFTGTELAGQCRFARGKEILYFFLI